MIDIPIFIKDMVSNLKITSKTSDRKDGEVNLSELLEIIELHQEESKRESQEKEYRDSSNW